MNGHHVNILAAANYLRERIARGAPDSRAQEIYDGLLDVLDPPRREARLKREAAAQAVAGGRVRWRRALCRTGRGTSPTRL